MSACLDAISGVCYTRAAACQLADVVLRQWHCLDGLIRPVEMGVGRFPWYVPPATPT